MLAGLRLSASLLMAALGVAHADSLEDGFRNPPMAARPSTYYLLLNGYVNRGFVEQELTAYKKAGIGGLCVFDMGARGTPETVPPAGPEFLSTESVGDLAHIIRTAGRLGMEVNLSVTSSWDMGGSWVKPEDGSMTLISSELQVAGPKKLDGTLPFPTPPKDTPKDAAGVPLFFRTVAALAIPNAARRAGWEFVYELPEGIAREVDHAAFYNSEAADRFGARDFTVSVSDRLEPSSFRDVLSGTLQARAGAQEFRFGKVRAKYVRLLIRNSYSPDARRAELAEFELYTPDGNNVLLSHSARRTTDGPKLIRFSSELGSLNDWSANNLNDGRKSGARGTWASAGPPPFAIEDRSKIVDLTGVVDRHGQLHWNVPAGNWTILWYICTNTGEHLKVPSPKSDGLATDHLNAAATERCMRYVVDRLKTAIPDLKGSALKNLYLASYEVQGQIWTPDFLDQFKARRGYDLKPFLPVLRGGLVDNEQTTERVRYDYEKTLGEMLVDNYYRAAGDVAHKAGVLIESESGGPGPPIHRVPVDALKALGGVDVVRGEFWPYRPDAKSMWVIKETASAAHIYGKPVVHMESFTSQYHWQEGPAFLKAAADRAFTEGMNHVVWHTASHQPPEAGKPGWVYGAGTHMSQNRVWWPMMHPFLEYLGRTSFLLQQGRFVADVLYYYGDQGYNFVMPKHADPSLGPGYDYDVTNQEVLLNRLSVRDGKLALPDGMSYEVLVLPEREDIDLATLRKVEALVRDGATVVGPKPKRSSGFLEFTAQDEEIRSLAAKLWGACDGTSPVTHEYGKGKVICGQTLREVLRARGKGPDFESRGAADLDYIHRSAAGAEIYFIRNRAKQWASAEVTFRVVGKQPEIWNPDTGEMRPYPMFTQSAGGVTVPLRFASEGSVFVVFRKSAVQPGIISVARSGQNISLDDAFAAIDPSAGVGYQAGAYDLHLANGSHRQVNIGALPAQQEVTGPWTVHFSEGLGAPPRVEFPKLMSWTESPDAGIRYFSGIAGYNTTFTVGREWLGSSRRVYLDLGSLWAAAEVQVNGKSLGITWKAPYRVDITEAIRAGTNQLSVRVANDWANRLIGDARDPTGKHYTRTNIVRTTVDGLPWEKVEPIPSGLFGPVILQTGEAFGRLD